ncbi:MAG: glycosyltransferase family 2 protein [Acidimicrobiia bacterium]|nr:glycosyltransferase family 2 protein [Acidimicrobiia bacterium]
MAAPTADLAVLLGTHQPTCSIIIPVYNSEGVVGETIDQTTKVCEQAAIDYELILVNDGSTDASWDVVAERAADDDRIVAVDLLKNYGQHTAVFAGLKLSKGRYAITMDDDLQNPPEEIVPLLSKAEEGYDLVVGRFHQKRHSLFRRWGSGLVDWMNRRIFRKPKEFVLTNFRCIRRDVIDRMVDYRTAYPYIPGLALMFSRQRANVPVEHRPRTVGTSNYNLARILAVVFRILFNYSSYPLRLVSGIGLLVTGIAFALTAYIFIRNLVVGSSVPGWTSVALMLTFFNGVTLLIISMLGEYLVRLLNQSSQTYGYHIRTIVGGDG